MRARGRITTSDATCLSETDARGQANGSVRDSTRGCQDNTDSGRAILSPGPVGPGKEKIVRWNPSEGGMVWGCWDLKRKFRTEVRDEPNRVPGGSDFGVRAGRDRATT